jgi:protein subunit release factor B
MMRGPAGALPPYSLDREQLQREIEIEAFRASGPGGQHVNKTCSAVRIRHLPSGVVVIAQESPSQHRNRNIAIERLIERLKRLNQVPKVRRATEPTRGARERRLLAKRARGALKASRGKGASREE